PGTARVGAGLRLGLRRAFRHGKSPLWPHSAIRHVARRVRVERPRGSTRAARVLDDVDVMAGGVTTQAVILARGLGTRMRRDSGEGIAPLSAAQAKAAESGAKGMMPFARPLLDYVISALADAGTPPLVH